MSKEKGSYNPEKLYPISQRFSKSKLDHMNLLFKNNVAILLAKLEPSQHEALGEMLDSMKECVLQLGQTKHVTYLSSRFMIEVPKSVDVRKIALQLEKEKNITQIERWHTDHEGKIQVIIHTQNMEWYDDIFEEFMQTYGNFLRNRSKKFFKNLNKSKKELKP